MKHWSEMLMLCENCGTQKKETEEEGDERDLKMRLLVLNTERSRA